MSLQQTGASGSKDDFCACFGHQLCNMQANATGSPADEGRLAMQTEQGLNVVHRCLVPNRFNVSVLQ
jgi:hypothetical protein